MNERSCIVTTTGAVRASGAEYAGAKNKPALIKLLSPVQLAAERSALVRELVDAGLRSVSVSMNAHDEPTYDLLCRPTFTKAYRAVLRFIRECVDAGLDVTATVVAVPQVDLEAAEAVATDLGASFRVRRPAGPGSPRLGARRTGGAV